MNVSIHLNDCKQNESQIRFEVMDKNSKDANKYTNQQKKISIKYKLRLNGLIIR